MITAHRAAITPHNNPRINKVNELEIATLEKAPRDPEALERLIQKKKLEQKRANDVTEIQNLAAEIEML